MMALSQPDYQRNCGRAAFSRKNKQRRYYRFCLFSIIAEKKK